MNSPLSYFGGKSRVAWVFFKKPESKVEVLNDRDNNIVNLYRVIQHHPEEFLRQFKILFVSRRIFELLKHHDDECLTDIHRGEMVLPFEGCVRRPHGEVELRLRHDGSSAAQSARP